MLSTLISIFVFLIVIGFLVFIHELGHFLAAKLVGVKVLEFAIGFGPTLIKKNLFGTEFKLNAIPLGGYVKLYGDRSNKEPGLTNQAYSLKPIYSKLIILVGGVTFNYILAIVISFIYLIAVSGQIQLLKQGDYKFSTTTTTQVLVNYIFPGTPAEGNLQINDTILELDGNVAGDLSLPAYLKADADGLVKVKVQRLDQQKELTIQLKEDRKLGISFSTIYNLDYPVNILSAVRYANDLFGYQFSVLANSVNKAVNKGDTSELSNNVGSIVSVGVAIDNIISSGQIQLIGQLMIALNLALVLFNLFPIPALDGGQALIEVIESVLRRKVPETVEQILGVGSFIFLVLLSVLLIFKDLSQFEVFNGIITTIRTVLGR